MLLYKKIQSWQTLCNNLRRGSVKISTAHNIIRPVPIEAKHHLDSFDCGKTTLNVWLREHALRNNGKASRTYVVTCKESDNVIAYYSLAAGAVFHRDAISKAKRNMPDPIPAILIGRLAVDSKWHGKGIGRGMLKAAINQSLQAADSIGVQVIFVHAIDDDAADFYKKYGFSPSPVNPMTLMLTIKDAHAAVYP